jgi:hypothetical protein
MEDYFIPKELDFEALRFCLDNYQPTGLYIRLKHSYGGAVKVNEGLEGRKLDFRKDDSGLHFLIDSKEVFHFPLKDYDGELQGSFSLEYERIKADDGVESLVIIQKGEDPYDPSLPEPRNSILRNVLDNHLLEITFKGRVNLKFHSWWHKPHWKYWMVV